MLKVNTTENIHNFATNCCKYRISYELFYQIILWPHVFGFRLHVHLFIINAGIILWMRPANERRCYSVTSSFIGWAAYTKWTLRMLNSSRLSYIIWHHTVWSALVWVRACGLFITKPFLKPVLTYCQIDLNILLSVILVKIQISMA